MSTQAAVLFDFDGVIADSEPLHYRAFKETAAHIGIEFSEREYYERLIGFDDRGAWRVLFSMRGRERDLTDAVLTDLMTRKTRIVQHLIETGQFAPLPGVEDFLKSLKRAGIQTAIYSGALRVELEPMLDGLGLRSYFALVTTADDVPIAKPHPLGYILTAQRLSQMVGQPLPPSRCLVIEDSTLVAANVLKEGFHVLGITSSTPPDRWPAGMKTLPTLENVQWEYFTDEFSK